MSMKSYALIGVAVVTTFTLVACSPQTEILGKKMVTSSPTAVPTPTPIPQVYGTDVNKVLIGATIHVPNTENDVKLTLGEGVQDFQQGIDRGDIMWGDIFVAKQVSDGYDVLGYVNVNNGGSGTQQYLVVYHVTADQKVNTAYIFVGDRIPVQKIEIKDGPSPDEYNVVVSSLTRQPDQAMVEAPTIPKTDLFTVTNHHITGGKNY